MKAMFSDIVIGVRCDDFSGVREQLRDINPLAVFHIPEFLARYREARSHGPWNGEPHPEPVVGVVDKDALLLPADFLEEVQYRALQRECSAD